MVDWWLTVDGSRWLILMANSSGDLMVDDQSWLRIMVSWWLVVVDNGYERKVNGIGKRFRMVDDRNHKGWPRIGRGICSEQPKIEQIALVESNQPVACIRFVKAITREHRTRTRFAKLHHIGTESFALQTFGQRVRQISGRRGQVKTFGITGCEKTRGAFSLMGTHALGSGTNFWVAIYVVKWNRLPSWNKVILGQRDMT